jgi:hypothetical protein
MSFVNLFPCFSESQPIQKPEKPDILSSILSNPNTISSIMGMMSAASNASRNVEVSVSPPEEEEPDYSYILECTPNSYTTTGNHFVVRSMVMTDPFLLRILANGDTVGVLSFTTTPQTIFHGSETLTQSVVMYWNTLNLGGKITNVSFDWLAGGSLLVNITSVYKDDEHQTTLQISQRMQ